MIRSLVYSYAAWFLLASVNVSAQSYAPLTPNTILEGSGISPHFGSSVSVNGLTVVVGSPAYGFDPYSNNEAELGAAFVYRYSDGTWSHQAKLSAPDAVSFDEFGHSVSVSGDFLLVGAPGLGKAYAFCCEGTKWTSSIELVPSDTTGIDGYGSRVAVVGDLAVVGTTSFGAGGSRQFVFRFDGDGWVEEAILEGTTRAAFAVLEDMILLEHYTDITVYRFEGGQWIEGDKLASQASPTRRVAAAGNVAVIPFREEAGAGELARVYRYNGAEWVEEAIRSSKLADDWGAEHIYATDGDQILMGAPWYGNPDFDVSSGLVYLYERGESDWLLKATSKGIDLDSDLWDLGKAVAVSRGVYVVGARGRAYVFGSPVSTDADTPDTIPQHFQLFQNYPNPFNPTTKIRFTLDESGFANLSVYDLYGRRVRTLVNETLSAGAYSTTFSAEGFASGSYFYNLDCNGQRLSGTMTLLK